MMNSERFQAEVDAALQDVVDYYFDALRDAMVEDLAARMTCHEIEAVARMAIMAGRSHDAAQILMAHAEADDDENDRHRLIGRGGRAGFNAVAWVQQEAARLGLIDDGEPATDDDGRARCADCGEPIEWDDAGEWWVHAEDANDRGDHTSSGPSVTEEPRT